MAEIIYENDNGKLKITKQVTEEVTLDKDTLISERIELLSRIAALEFDHERQINFFAERVNELDEKIAKCTELGIKTQNELTEENL